MTHTTNTETTTPELVDDFEFDSMDDTCDPAPTREQQPWEGVAGALMHSIRALGVSDDFGVTVTVNEASSYADVSIDIPNGLPEHSKDQLRTLTRQRIYYTAMDRVYDDHFGNPSSSRHHRSVFVTTVGQALKTAYLALTSACFAHARGEAWTIPVEPVERDDWRYEGWYQAPDLP